MNSRKVFGTVICAFLVLATSSAIALGQVDPAAYRLITGDTEESPPVYSGTPMDQSPGVDNCNLGCNPGCGYSGCGQRCYCPRWTASADFIILERIGSVDQTLVRGVPLDDDDTFLPAGAELLNANDFHQGFYGGPRVGLIRHGDCCYDLELLYFQIDGWSSTRRILPDDELLVFSIRVNLPSEALAKQWNGSMLPSYIMPN